MARKAKPLTVAKEELSISKTKVPSQNIHIEKSIQEHEHIIDEPLLSDQVRIERIAMDQFVDAVREPIHDENTTIIPIYKEVLVVQKRLKLVEEIHIIRTQSVDHRPERHITREETAIITKHKP